MASSLCLPFPSWSHLFHSLFSLLTALSLTGWLVFTAVRVPTLSVLMLLGVEAHAPWGFDCWVHMSPLLFLIWRQGFIKCPSVVSKSLCSSDSSWMWILQPQAWFSEIIGLLCQVKPWAFYSSQTMKKWKRKKKKKVQILTTVDK